MTDEHYDLVIVNGTIIDVIQERFLHANIGIKQGKIAIITKQEIQGLQKIDATGYMVSPGFIDFNSHVDGSVYAAECILQQGGTTTLGGERTLNSKIVKNIAEDGFILNHGFFVSQSFVLRDAVGIKNLYQHATEKEIDVMTELAAKFMEAGAFGICFTLELVPGVTKKELIAISKVAKAYDKVVTIHLRKDGKEALETFDEIFEMAVTTGVKVHLLELMYMVGMSGVMPKALHLIDDAKKSGIDITGDCGVYENYTVCIGSGVFDDGWEHGYDRVKYSDLLISSGIHAGEKCTEALFHYLRKTSPSTLITAFVGDKEAFLDALQREYIYVSTNAADGPFYPGSGSPEVAGTYPRLIGVYVREQKQISLMKAIQKITILPARRFGLKNIGSLVEGNHADITIFDYHTILDRADFMDRGRPDMPPIGIEYVIINGNIALEKGNIRKGKKYGKYIVT